MQRSRRTVDPPWRRRNSYLTPIEFRLLAVLLNNTGKVLTQRQLLNQSGAPTPWSIATICASYMTFTPETEQDPTRPRHFITETGNWLSLYAVNSYSLFLNNF